MSVDNQIIHPSRCYGIFKSSSSGTWTSLKGHLTTCTFVHHLAAMEIKFVFCGLLDVPYFYKNFDEKSAAFVEGLDEDYEKIRQAIRRKYPSLAFSGMFSYLQLQAFAHKVTHSTYHCMHQTRAHAFLIATCTCMLCCTTRNFGALFTKASSRIRPWRPSSPQLLPTKMLLYFQ